MAPERSILICGIRPSRVRARRTAIAEMLTLLRDCGAEEAAGGPLSEQSGIYWIWISTGQLERASALFPRLGFTSRVSIPVHPTSAPKNPVRWRKRDWELQCLYAEDEERLRLDAPDRREFLLEDDSGRVRAVRGYRGDGDALSRRGLPVSDARALVNLAAAAPGCSFLEPFAGIGGLVREAVAAGCRVYSVDVDPKLRHGLKAFGAEHLVADASRMPFADCSFDCAAAEPPYHLDALQTVASALKELSRLLRPGGRLAMLAAEVQHEPLLRTATTLPVRLLLEEPIDRKGLSTIMLVWEKRTS